MASTNLPSTKAVPPLAQSLRPLWFSLLAGPVCYMLYFFVGYMLAEAACAVNFWQLPLLNVPSWIWVELGLTLLTVVLIVLGGQRALVEWRRTRQQAIEDSPTRFMAFGGLFLVPLFVLVTLVTGISFIVLQPCTWI